ncbi:MAG: flagellin [Methanobacteriota archaeon]
MDSWGDIGVGSMIIFIAALLVAGVTANVLIQTMNSLQQQALQTGQETQRQVSSGVQVTHVSGYVVNSEITQLAIFISPSAASEDINLTTTYVSLSNSSKMVILNYTSTCYSSTVSNGLFDTINASNLTASSFGLIVIRDADSSCRADSPTINERDLVVIIVNTTDCFSGIEPRKVISGNVHPEYGMSGVISFVTPAAYVDTIVDL